MGSILESSPTPFQPVNELDAGDGWHPHEVHVAKGWNTKHQRQDELVLARQQTEVGAPPLEQIRAGAYPIKIEFF